MCPTLDATQPAAAYEPAPKEDMRQQPPERDVELRPDALDAACLEVGVGRIDIYRNDNRIGFFYLRASDEMLLIADFQIRSDVRTQGYGTAALNRLVALAQSAGYTLLAGLIEWGDWDRVDELSAFFRKRGFSIGEKDHINLRATSVMKL